MARGFPPNAGWPDMADHREAAAKDSGGFTVYCFRCQGSPFSVFDRTNVLTKAGENCATHTQAIFDTTKKKRRDFQNAPRQRTDLSRNRRIV